MRKKQVVAWIPWHSGPCVWKIKEAFGTQEDLQKLINKYGKHFDEVSGEFIPKHPGYETPGHPDYDKGFIRVVYRKCPPEYIRASAKEWEDYRKEKEEYSRAYWKAMERQKSGVKSCAGKRKKGD